MSEVYLNLLATTLTKEWEQIVKVALETGPEDVKAAATAIAYASKAGVDSIVRKIQAIQYVASQGMTEPVIVELGQEAVVSSFNKSKKQDQLEQQVFLKFKVSGSLRDAMEEERARICKVLRFVSSEQFILWVHAQLSTTTEEELLHAAGETRNPHKSQKSDGDASEFSEPHPQD